MRLVSAVYIVAILALFFSCTTEVPGPVSGVQLPEDLANLRDEIDETILETIRETGQPFNWNSTNNNTIYSALAVSDFVLAIGYHEMSDRDELLKVVYRSEEKNTEEYGSLDDVLKYKDDDLYFIGVRIENASTLEKIRAFEGTSWVEVSDYPFDFHKLLPETETTPIQRSSTSTDIYRRDMILDPQLDDPNYVDQVNAFDGGLRTVIRRHNMEEVYLEQGLFGDGIDVAIVDNGVLPGRLDFFEGNGYGERYKTGYYNPWWFFPIVPPDGYQPRPTDIFGLSILIYDTYYIHGSEMIKQVLTLAPNSNIHSVRGSTWTVILFIDQIVGICNAIKAQADNPDIKITSMSMGTIFHFNRIVNAIQYYHEKDKLIVVSAGSTFAATTGLGVLFPGQLPETVTATAILNRENTNGEFILTEGVHGGPENDFTVESTNSSSVATSRMAGMMSLVWSANASLSRDEVFNILIEASYFYQNNGVKDPLFGWGTVDVGMAVELAQ